MAVQLHSVPHPEWDRIGEVFLGNRHALATLAMQRMMIGAVARATTLAVPCLGCPSSWVHRALVSPCLLATLCLTPVRRDHHTVGDTDERAVPPTHGLAA